MIGMAAMRTTGPHAFHGASLYGRKSGGFVDAWSGHGYRLGLIYCDHCLIGVHTKDAFIGPHTNVKKLTITNSQSVWEHGAQWKWIKLRGTGTFQNI